jgi:serine/threonine-protein kinase
MMRRMEAAETVLRAGDRLDRYELLCPIASGGMATVWLARLRGKRGFEKLFAVKTIRTELVEDSRFQEMFLDEARIASGIQHPNVAQILDLGEERGVLFIVMEWVDGDSLTKVRKAAVKRDLKIPVGVALRVLADACAGLHAAHELRDENGHALGIVHRDVSPQNILVSAAGSVKVIDFGIAKAHNRKQGETGTGIVKGKIQYMAPEQIKKGRAVDRRTDVWALGVCLHELVTGRLPNDGDDDIEVIRKLLGDEVPRRVSGLPEAIVRILDRSIALDADDRFPTAAGMQRALEGAMLELGDSTTSEDVASFLRSSLPELVERRRELVVRAIEDARLRPDAPAAAASEAAASEEVAFAATLVGDDLSGARRKDEARAIALTRRKPAASSNATGFVSAPTRQATGFVAASAPRRRLFWPGADSLDVRPAPRSAAGFLVLALLFAGGLGLVAGARLWRASPSRGPLGSSSDPAPDPAHPASTAAAPATPSATVFGGRAPGRDPSHASARAILHRARGAPRARDRGRRQRRRVLGCRQPPRPRRAGVDPRGRRAVRAGRRRRGSEQPLQLSARRGTFCRGLPREPRARVRVL